MFKIGKHWQKKPILRLRLFKVTGTSLGDSEFRTELRDGFFCFPIKHSTHTLLFFEVSKSLLQKKQYIPIMFFTTRTLCISREWKFTMGNVCGCESSKVGDVLAKELGGSPEPRPSRASLGSLHQSMSSPLTPRQVPSLSEP